MIVAGRGWTEVSEIGDFLFARGLGCNLAGEPWGGQDPEVNERGEATFAEQFRMMYGPVRGAWRATSTAENDPWYGPPGPPLRAAADTSGWRR